jgi:hypothetical protein
VNGQIGLIPGNYLDIIEEIPIGSDDSSEGDDTVSMIIITIIMIML